MSVIFGRWNFDGRIASPDFLNNVRTVARCVRSRRLPLLFQRRSNHRISIAFHTTKQSRHQLQPFVSKSGLVFAWDGRLDNRKELIEQSRAFALGRLGRCLHCGSRLRTMGDGLLRKADR